MRLGLQQRVQRLEKMASASFSFCVAILQPVNGGYRDQYGKTYKKLDDCPASVKIINDIPRPPEFGGDVT